MSKSSSPENTQSRPAVPCTESPSKPLALPPPDDPSWKEAAQAFQDFFDSRPDYDEECEERLREYFKCSDRQ